MLWEQETLVLSSGAEPEVARELREGSWLGQQSGTKSDESLEVEWASSLVEWLGTALGARLVRK